MAKAKTPRAPPLLERKASGLYSERKQRILIGSFLVPSIFVVFLVLVGHAHHHETQKYLLGHYHNDHELAAAAATTTTMAVKNKEDNPTIAMDDNDNIQNNQRQAEDGLAYNVSRRDVADSISIPHQIDEKDEISNPISIKKEENMSNVQYYYLHIPKVGGKSMKSMLQFHGAPVKNMGPTSMHWSRHETLFDEFEKWSKAYPEFRVIMSSGDGYRYRTSKSVDKEELQEEKLFPRHSLVMFRDPVSHVISQYIHCRDWQLFHGSPSVPYFMWQWLKGWHRKGKQEPVLKNANSTRTKRCRDREYKCFVPWNLQSWFVGLGRTHPKKLKRALKARFDVVGTMADMKLSACLFLTQVLQKVPSICVCGDRNGVKNQTHRELVLHEMAWRSIEHHHAGVFKEAMTHNELQMIRNLTQQDHLLYDEATSIMEEQATEIETTYGVKLCRIAHPVKRKYRTSWK